MNVESRGERLRAQYKKERPKDKGYKDYGLKEDGYRNDAVLEELHDASRYANRAVSSGSENLRFEEAQAAVRRRARELGLIQ
jgi:hypothetical protein